MYDDRHPPFYCPLVPLRYSGILRFSIYWSFGVAKCAHDCHGRPSINLVNNSHLKAGRVVSATSSHRNLEMISKLDLHFDPSDQIARTTACDDKHDRNLTIISPCPLCPRSSTPIRQRVKGGTGYGYLREQTHKCIPQELTMHANLTTWSDQILDRPFNQIDYFVFSSIVWRPKQRH